MLAAPCVQGLLYVGSQAHNNSEGGSSPCLQGEIKAQTAGAIGQRGRSSESQDLSSTCLLILRSGDNSALSLSRWRAPLPAPCHAPWGPQVTASSVLSGQGSGCPRAVAGEPARIPGKVGRPCIHPSTFISPSIHLPTHPFTCQSIHLSTHPFIHPSIHLSVQPSYVCLWSTNCYLKV